MSEQVIDVQTVANDFASSVEGRLDQDKIDAAVSSLLAGAASYGANGNVASLIFYLKFQVNVNGGKSFNGNAGGISSPGGGALFGDVYTNDLQALYTQTRSFQFNATPVYLNINFFDGNGNFLGSFQSGGISTVLGTGGGSGSWS
ncbi:VapA/VapB family virulence-associated protein [Sinomonas sp. JGH33]|uniref:VapA/VapB family virulence-associated protein n=1 Tax=Sinomonas terricola TaxID=3110330 RepID=A0ABU5TAN1_9MICC|nr:VapA/VapB family virulence-associated protein [Sinomonas sp. JGH33]MEA5456700.1 VapA/VapB family virulence-associated protein [Sinomonas sp. JGH33]